MTFFLDKQTSASDIFSSCPFLLRTNLELSLVMINNMVTRYDVIVGVWFFFLKWKCMFFNMFQLENQTTPVGKMTQITYLCVILHVKDKKLPILSVFTRFLFLGKIQDGHFWGRHRPPAAPPPIKYGSSCWEDETLFNEGKIFSKYSNISKPRGRGSINANPPCTTVRVWLCVHMYFRGSIN